MTEVPDSGRAPRLGGPFHETANCLVIVYKLTERMGSCDIWAEKPGDQSTSSTGTPSSGLWMGWSWGADSWSGGGASQRVWDRSGSRRPRFLGGLTVNRRGRPRRQAQRLNGVVTPPTEPARQYDDQKFSLGGNACSASSADAGDSFGRVGGRVGEAKHTDFSSGPLVFGFDRTGSRATQRAARQNGGLWAERGSSEAG